MSGLLIFLFSAWGLAGLVPRPGTDDAWPGVRAFTGFMLIPLIVFLLHQVAAVPWRTSCFIIAALTVAGYLRLAWQFATDPTTRPPLSHPLFLLPLAAILVVIAEGGVGYLPYAGDEFSNWIGVAKQLFAAGGYAAGRPYMINPTYTVGWPMILAYPMVLLDRFDEGLAAPAPLAMRIAFAGMVFDLLRRAIAEARLADERRGTIYCWTVVLVLLAAEASGRLWPYNLLIEPPQILGYGAILLLVIHAANPGERTSIVWGILGVSLAAQYLLKVAALSLAPALLLPVAAAFYGNGAMAQKARSAALRLALIMLPLVVTALLWRAITPERYCIASPLQLLAPDRLALLMSDRAADLAQRFGAAVWDYVASYKTPLTLGGVAGLVAGLMSRRLRLAAVVLGAFAVCYFAALYWYHLTCFGENYFRELNSIPRFTRVVLRLVHGVGLVLLILWILDRVRAGRMGWVRALSADRRIAVLAAVLLAALSGWEIVKLDRTVTDMASRAHQKVLPNVRIIPKDDVRIRALIGTRLPDRPTAAVIDTRTTLDAYLITHYYGMGTVFGGGPFAYEVLPRIVWRPRPADPAGARAWGEEMTATLRQVDFVWPLVLDPTLRDFFASRIADRDCRGTPTAYFLLPVKGDRLSFTCIRK